MEQVCRVLHVSCRRLLLSQRGTSEESYLVELLAYHQARNLAATRSKKKKQPVARTRKKPRPPKKSKNSKKKKYK